MSGLLLVALMVCGGGLRAQSIPFAPDRQPPPVAPQDVRPGDVVIPSTAIPPLPDAASRIIRVVPRYATPYQLVFRNLNDREQAAFFTGGLIVTAVFPDGTLLDIEADRVILWTRNDNTQEVVNQLSLGQPQSNDRELEFYLTGNVEIRTKVQRPGQPTRDDELQEQVLRADSVYYDAKRNRALAVQGDLELTYANLNDTVHLRADEIQQLAPREYRALEAEIFSSRLPANPGLKLSVSEAHVREVDVPVLNPLGRIYRRINDLPLTERQQRFTATNTFLEVLDTPVLYFPYASGELQDPLGPLEGIGFRQDQNFGTQILTSWDTFDLLGLPKQSGRRWLLYADYLSDRGPGGGTSFDYAGTSMFGIPTRYTGRLEGYGIYDEGVDQLGGIRSNLFEPPSGRGRVLYRHIQELPAGFTFQGQYSYLSDPNFLESYYKFEFDRDPNQETFGYLKWQQDNFAATLLTKPNIRGFVNETQWLPLGEFHALGLSFLDRISYNAWGGAGYANLVTADTAPPLLPTTVPIETGRFNVRQEASVPLQLGPVKLVPYGTIDLAYYSQDLNGDDQGRFYGGGGVRASLPLSRLYPSVNSELLNLQGLFHKIVIGGNYYASHSDVPFSQLPQLDRLNDDATDQSIRDITPRQADLLGAIGNRAAGVALQTSPIFNPQLYAIRRLVDTRVDTIDSIQVFQFDLRQRWQTKRGFPGQEHIIDWLTLDFSTSFFPNPNEDNFGESVAFTEYNSLWNIGDRTGFQSAGWFDPFDFGTRYFSIGTFYERTASSRLYLGYRHIDPLESRAVTASVGYIFSPKYAVSGNTTYDFGIRQSLSNSLIFTRIGTDVTLSFGVTYDALIDNFGVTFEVIPNLVAAARGRALAPVRSTVFGSR